MPPLIDEDLCNRLKRFDPHCEISMIRTSPMNDSPWAAAGARRVWVVVIRRSNQGTSALWDAVSHIHPRLTDALTLAVSEAEQRGWARPAFPPSGP